VGAVEGGMQGRRRGRGWDAGKEDSAGGGRIAGRKTARAGLQEGRWHRRGLERGHGEVGGRPRSSLKV
jgi:hypothetical protein